MNVGAVAEALFRLLPDSVRALLPSGSITLAALHDIGKITLGFQAKCGPWLAAQAFDETVRAEACAAAGHSQLSDHALFSQVFLQDLLKPNRAHLWAVAAGAHHGRVKGRNVTLKLPELQGDWAETYRRQTAEELIRCFGPLPSTPPDNRFGLYHSDLWLLAGLITVADWLGSNELFFSPNAGVPLEQSRCLAAEALKKIGWPGGSLRPMEFETAFGFKPNPLQDAVGSASPGRLILVEGPMGCGKTEAALNIAQQLIASGKNHGLYFALPTQVTSNRIHQRIQAFLQKTLADGAHLRLAHGNAWLNDDFDLRLHPSAGEKYEEHGLMEQVREARSWFASSKQALLAPYGVGTVDQALQGIVAVKHFFVRRFALAGKVVILDEIHSYDIYTGTLISHLIRELWNLGCTVILLSATLTAARRAELLSAIGASESDAPEQYPLVTICNDQKMVEQRSPEWTQEKQIALRVAEINEVEVVAALIERAEAGQQVLWIRNTVAEAQEAYRIICGSMCEGGITVGLLHSRFPFARRETLEKECLDRLGKGRLPGGPGSILIATQVVEQSVDIDLDFIISDLAPTDMILQRMGRLWRHERQERPVEQPEFWVRLPDWSSARTAADLKRALGKSGKVYAPYVLLRSASVFTGRDRLALPSDIRALLEATYAEPSSDEPEGWRELRRELEREKRKLQLNAEAVTRIFGLPQVNADNEKALTRWPGPPTVDVVLLRSVEQLPGNQWRLHGLDGKTVDVSDFEWRRAAAKFLHCWLVRVPRWMVPADTPHPRWLVEHLHGGAAYACVGDDGRCQFGDEPSVIIYHEMQGVYAERPVKEKRVAWNDDDDEFDY